VQIQYFHEFIEELERLDKGVQKQIKKKLQELYRTPIDQFGSIALKGKQFQGLYKLRIGDWRLIYKIAGKEYHFITLGHRSEVYKGQ